MTSKAKTGSKVTAPTRLLAVNLNYLGDALFTTPALDSLRTRFPHATIDVLAGGPAKAMLTGNPDINEIIERPPHGGSGRATFFAQTLHQGRYDAVVLFQSTFSNAFLAWAARVPVRVGFAQDGCGPLLTHAVPARRPGEHVVDAYTRLARAWNGEQAAADERMERLSITVAPSDAAFAQEFLHHEAVAPTVGLVIGATRPQKRWPEEYFARLADKLWNAHGLRCVLLGGPAEGESARRIASQTRVPLVSAVGQTTEKQLAALIARLSVVVSGDSGPLHIATAMNTPVVALFGSTDPLETGPWQPKAGGAPSVVLYDALPCAPCRKTPTCNGRFDCLRALTPERVFDATGELLNLASRRVTLPVAPSLPTSAPAKRPAPIPATRPRRRVSSVFVRPALPNPVRSVVVVTKHHYMGDTIVAVPMLRAVRTRFPDARITLVTGRMAAVALENGDFADHIEPYNPHDPQFDADALCHALQKASEPDNGSGPDLCLLADRSFRSARMAWRIGARVRVGFASEYRGFLLTHRVPYRLHQPETECILDVMRAVAPEKGGESRYDSRPCLVVTAEERERARHILAEHAVALPDRAAPLLVGMQPGANYAAKQWNPRKFAQVAGALAQNGATIVLLGKGATEAEAAEIMRQALPPNTPVIDLTDATSLRETMAVLTHLRLFIGNDTGVNHLAAAVGLPTIGLFGPTSAVKWGNTGKRGTVLAAPHGDLSRLEARPVLEAAQKLLAQTLPAAFAFSTLGELAR